MPTDQLTFATATSIYEIDDQELFQCSARYPKFPICYWSRISYLRLHLSLTDLRHIVLS